MAGFFLHLFLLPVALATDCYRLKLFYNHTPPPESHPGLTTKAESVDECGMTFDQLGHFTFAVYSEDTMSCELYSDFLSYENLALHENRVTLFPMYQDCLVWKEKGYTVSGMYLVSNGTVDYEVYCDMTTDGGGWLVFQRRYDGTLGFNQYWSNYANGFGDPRGEFWLGNEIIHALTAKRSLQLRVEIRSFDGLHAFAKYSSFSLGDLSTKYTLRVSGYDINSTAGDNFRYFNRYDFCTRDKDNDNSKRWVTSTSYYVQNLAAMAKAGWWWKDTTRPAYGSLNGVYTTRNDTDIVMSWWAWKRAFVPLSGSTMMMRP